MAIETIIAVFVGNMPHKKLTRHTGKLGCRRSPSQSSNCLPMPAPWPLQFGGAEEGRISLIMTVDEYASTIDEAQVSFRKWRCHGEGIGEQLTLCHSDLTETEFSSVLL
jgi:hypothetical protein